MVKKMELMNSLENKLARKIKENGIRYILQKIIIIIIQNQEQIQNKYSSEKS